MENQKITEFMVILSRYTLKIIEDFSETALMLNAVDVSRKYYKDKPSNVEVTTMGNVPPGLKIELDVEVVYRKNDLIKKYRGEIPNKIAKDYVIRTVSIVDAFLEDVYESLLKIYHPELDDNKLGSKVRSAWSNDNLRNFLINEVGLKKPQNKISTIEMTFDRYEEWREIRHAIMHNGGILGEKHVRKLDELKRRLVAIQGSAQGGGTIENLHIISGRDINVKYQHILYLRWWCLTFMFYLRDCFKETFQSN